MVEAAGHWRRRRKRRRKVEGVQEASLLRLIPGEEVGGRARLSLEGEGGRGDLLLLLLLLPGEAAGRGAVRRAGEGGPGGGCLLLLLRLIPGEAGGPGGLGAVGVLLLLLLWMRGSCGRVEAWRSWTPVGEGACCLLLVVCSSINGEGRT
jgi:hypothetical protein